MSDTGHDQNRADPGAERCGVHGDRSSLIDTEQGQEITFRDVDDYFDCQCLHSSLEEKLQRLRVHGLALLEELGANFTNNPEVVDALERLHELVDRAPIPSGHDAIRFEGQQWWTVTESVRITQEMLSCEDRADPRWLVSHEATDSLLEGIERLRACPTIAGSRMSIGWNRSPAPERQCGLDWGGLPIWPTDRTAGGD